MRSPRKCDLGCVGVGALVTSTDALTSSPIFYSFRLASTNRPFSSQELVGRAKSFRSLRIPSNHRISGLARVATMAPLLSLPGSPPFPLRHGVSARRSSSFLPSSFASLRLCVRPFFCEGTSPPNTSHGSQPVGLGFLCWGVGVTGGGQFAILRIGCGSGTPTTQRALLRNRSLTTW